MGGVEKREALTQFIEGLCEAHHPGARSAIPRVARSQMVWAAQSGNLKVVRECAGAAKIPRDQLEAGIALIYG